MSEETYRRSFGRTGARLRMTPPRVCGLTTRLGASAEYIMAIRNTCKALVVKDGKLLLCKNVRPTDDRCWWVLPQGAVCCDLPGGGQNMDETLEEAAVRECLEETGYTAAVKRLAAVYEMIFMSEHFRARYLRHVHKVHFIFLCELTDAPRVMPTEMDTDMQGTEWVDLRELENTPLYPAVVKDNIHRMLDAKEMLFLGSQREV